MNKKFEKNIQPITLNILQAKNKKIYPAYVSKQNSKREKQVILLTISSGEGWHYFAVKRAISIVIKSNNVKTPR